jgi:membrane associated rhomboid family serine protease
MAATCYRHPDRETGLSCSECGRPICVDCMTVAPVGIRCPDHARTPARAQPVTQRVRNVGRTTAALPPAIVTKVLVGVNVGIYVLQLLMGASINANSGWIFDHGALVTNILYTDGSIGGLAHGDWWRLLTAAFLHYGPIHLGMNMLALWWLGAPVEMALGHWRFLLLYLVSGLAGSAGSLLVSPHSITVGASGAIFGMLGAGLVLEYEATGRLGGNYLTLIIVNLAFTFAVPGISIGGHLGGLVGGALGALALTGFGREARSFRDVSASRTIALVGIGVLSVAVAYWRVRGLA